MENSPEHLDLNPQLCRSRQQRLVSAMQQLDLDSALLQQPENVQWLTGFRPHRLMGAAVFLTADRHCTLSAPNAQPDNVAADEITTFESQWCCTLRQEQSQAALEALLASTGSLSGRIGIELSTAPGHAGLPADRTRDVEPLLWRLRRRKDSDEMALMRRAIECTAAMYRTAREIIEPGITELEVFNRLHAAAVSVAGEPLTHPLGNDYQCGSPGGPPRDRPAAAGELFVLDLGPSYRGYYADNCRTICVGGSPTDEQQQAWEAIVGVLTLVEETVKPGTRCANLYRQAKETLDAVRPDAFFHHLGHGVGLFPHEAPHLNPNWDDSFEEGDVFTAEPGLYWPELKAGIRLEQNYQVTSGGVELLTPFPLEL